MSAKKIISIAGATGKQGGALLQSLLKDPEFTARALTRDVNSAKSLELKKAGAEVVKADISNEDSIAEAIKGSYGMFCVTALEFDNPEKEMAQAQAMANAARKAGIKHIVWSTLEDTRLLVPLESNTMPTLFGNYKVPHFDAKGASDKYFADLPTTYLLTSYFWDNFLYGGPAPGPDGKLHLTIPMGTKRLPGVGTEDIGKTAHGIFKRPDLINQRVALAGEILTGAQYAAVFSKVFGKEVTYNSVPFEAFRKFGFHGAEDLANMFQYKHDTEETFCGTRQKTAQLVRELNPELRNFEQWLVKNKNLFKL